MKALALVILMAVCSGCASYPPVGPLSLASYMIRNGQEAEEIERAMAFRVEVDENGEHFVGAAADMAALPGIIQQIRQDLEGASARSFWGDIAIYTVGGIATAIVANQDDGGGGPPEPPPHLPPGSIFVGGDAYVEGKLDTDGESIWINGNLYLRGSANTGGWLIPAS